MDLPELGNIERRNRLAELLSRAKELQRFNGDIGPLDYELSKKGLRLNGEYQNTMAELMLRPNGNWNANITRPMFGGNLSLQASDGDEGRKYYLQFQRQF